jgi:hypothetical protein
MITKKAHEYIAKSIRDSHLSTMSRRTLVTLLSEYFEKDNPATFNPKRFASMARGTLKEKEDAQV